MKEKPDSLFYFVKTLSPVEKRRFRQYASLQKGEKGYMRLFDLLLDMKVYDEEVIKTQLSGDPLLNHLSRYKNYLFNLILKALTAFYNGPDADLSNLVRQVKIAVGKRAFPKALELISKGKEIASAQERFEEWLNLLKIERKLLLDLPQIQDFDGKIATLLEELKTVKSKLQNLNDFEDLEDELIMLRRRKYFVRGEEDRSLINRLAEHPLMASEDQARSVRAKFIYFRNLHGVCWTRQDVPGAIQCILSMIDLLEINGFLMLENRNFYFQWLLQANYLYLWTGNQGESLKYLDKLGNVQVVDNYEKVLLFDKQVMGNLIYTTSTGDMRPGLEACKLVKRRLPEYQSNLKIEDILQVWFYVTKVYMQAKDYDSAYSAVQSFIRLEEKGVREDFQSFIRILQLIILFEQQDWIGLESNARSVKRHIKKKDQWYQYETLLVKFLSNAVKYAERDQIQEKLAELKTAIQEVTEAHPNEKTGLHYFDAIKWIEEKIS